MLPLDELKTALAHDDARKRPLARPEIDVPHVRRLILDAILLAEEADIALVGTRPIPIGDVVDRLTRASAKLRAACEVAAPSSTQAGSVTAG